MNTRLTILGIFCALVNVGSPVATQQDKISSIQEQIQLGIKTLSDAQQREEQESAERKANITSVISQHFPWMIKSNFVPFNFTRGKDMGKQIDNSLKNTAVFVHQHNPQNIMKDCMKTVANKVGFPLSVVTSGEKREDWDKAKSPDNNYRNKYALHWGSYTFGMCDSVNNSCSYFAIFQEPLERAVNLYNYCQNFVADTMCVLNANHMTLREWIINMGSLTFYQLTHQPNICHSFNISTLRENSAIDIPEGVKKLPCWFKHKYYIDNNISNEHRRLLLDYVVKNLQQWFSVIGLSADMEITMKSFQHVYGEPFRECRRHQSRKDRKQIVSNRANTNSGFRPVDSDVYDENNPDNLQHDWAVQESLLADMEIYEQAKRLFKIQKQILTNKLK